MHVDATVLTVDVQRDQALDRAGRRRLPVQRRRCGTDSAEDEATAPAAMTPLMKPRRDTDC